MLNIIVSVVGNRWINWVGLLICYRVHFFFSMEKISDLCHAILFGVSFVFFLLFFFFFGYFFQKFNYGCLSLSDQSSRLGIPFFKRALVVYWLIRFCGFSLLISFQIFNPVILWPMFPFLIIYFILVQLSHTQGKFVTRILNKVYI